ncbi:hypothetical protein [Streptomyces sp. S1A1-7]|uniref:hypothetical protein n=1 Tax=Streptomyces sp. S1A1-7 TaxID=2594459 RepID=UPI001F073369|nr:hypothetical protein [Streptomyces sp. S1A1-7]
MEDLFRQGAEGGQSLGDLLDELGRPGEIDVVAGPAGAVAQRGQQSLGGLGLGAAGRGGDEGDAEAG